MVSNNFNICGIRQERWKVGAEAPLYFFSPPIEALNSPSAPFFKNLYLQYTLLRFNDGFMTSVVIH